MANDSNVGDSSQVSPSRSRTDPPSPEMHREKSHLHRRLHSSSLRNRTFVTSKDKEHHLRQSAKETVQSAIELRPPISFDALLRREKKTPDSSRRGSTSFPQNQQSDSAAEARAQQAVRVERKQVTAEDVRKAEQDNARRDEELRKSLKDTEQIAMQRTRELDDTYYSILEKVSLLRSTVTGLRQLVAESGKMHTRFQEDTTKLEQDTRKNADAFGNFNAQEEHINELVRQLKTSQDRTDRLNERLEAARNRVAAFEQREMEKQKAARQRMGIVWVVLISLLGFLIALVVAKHRTAVRTRLHQVAQAIDHDLASPLAAVLKPSATPSEDPYLKKLFDEL